MDRVREVIAEQLCVDVANVVPAANLVDDLEADSLDMVELTMMLEEAFDIEIPDEQAEKWKTVEDVEKYIAKCDIAQA